MNLIREQYSLLPALQYPVLKAFWITMAIGLAFLALCSVKSIFKIHSPTVQINHVLYIGGNVTNGVTQ